LFLEFRGVFSDTAASLYKKTIINLQEKLKPIIVSAMLDHDSLQGTSSGKSIEVFIEPYFFRENKNSDKKFLYFSLYRS
jgi:hypothetical protein